jgi:hypothetical protein
MGTGLICLRLVLFCALCLLTGLAPAQTPAQISTELETLNAKVTNWPNTHGSGLLITNNAMNIFLSEKVASYLSDEHDLSLYKTSVRADMAEGRLAIDHNFHQPIDSDEPLRSFTLVGARVNFADAYASRYAHRYPNNRLGFVLQQTWLAAPVTRFHNGSSRKQSMDAQRALLVQQLESGVQQEAAGFEAGLQRLQVADVPGQSLYSALVSLRRDFYTTLRAKYLQKFSEGQSDVLVNSPDGYLVSAAWTSAGIYIPVIPQKFGVAADGGIAYSSRLTYPLSVFVIHTRFWTAPHLGRLFLTFDARCTVNDAAATGLLMITNEGRYNGDFHHFLTPLLGGKLAWLPGDSHVGLSFRLEKSFGEYRTVNAIAGIPIVLIDKNGVPAINFECQLRLAGLWNTSTAYELPGNRTTVGLTIGIPFSKIAY